MKPTACGPARCKRALASHPAIKLGQIIDLSATPIFINPGKTHRPADTRKLKDGEPFPWIVAERGLMEAGLVKIPQPPTIESGDRADGVRDLYAANGGRALNSEDGRRRKVFSALDLLVRDYEDTAERWSDPDQPRAPHPVLIVVASDSGSGNAPRPTRSAFELIRSARVLPMLCCSLSLSAEPDTVLRLDEAFPDARCRSDRPSPIMPAGHA